MFPLLYEINTRCWLQQLSQEKGKRIDLSTVPLSEFKSWVKLGFTHIWLMGVWTSSTRARDKALQCEPLLNRIKILGPTWSQDDLQASPYAITAYTVHKDYGGDEALSYFRKKLNEAGLKLILDFVPNHLGLDHPWLHQYPERFVQSAEAHPGFFMQETVHGPQWIAHGKDPYFPPWTDTAQLDYRNPNTRQAMIQQLLDVSCKCDGVRCDMAMLLLNEICERTWNEHACASAEATGEFWQEAIDLLKSERCDFLFLGEVYWRLEARLHALGFDYTYDKEFYDHIAHQKPELLRDHLQNASNEWIERSAHFLENHDEPRVAGILSEEVHFCAILLILALPGLRFLHQGQLEGAEQSLPVQLARFPQERSHPRVGLYYRRLLDVLKSSPIGSGEWKRSFIGPGKTWPLCLEWATAKETWRIIVNFQPQSVDIPAFETVKRPQQIPREVFATPNCPSYSPGQPYLLPGFAGIILRF